MIILLFMFLTFYILEVSYATCALLVLFPIYHIVGVLCSRENIHFNDHANVGIGGISAWDCLLICHRLLHRSVLCIEGCWELSGVLLFAARCATIQSVYHACLSVIMPIEQQRQVYVNWGLYVCVSVCVCVYTRLLL